MLKIRLTRIGKKKQPHFRIVVMDKRSKVQGAYVESLGWYDPRTKKVNIKDDRVKEWMDKGAQPSNSLAVLLKKEGLRLPGWVEIKKRKPKLKKEKTEDKPKVKAEVAELKEGDQGQAVEVEADKTQIEGTDQIQNAEQTRAVEADPTQIQNADQK